MPIGEWAQESYENNPYQKHISTWYPDELEAYGYSIYPIEGLKRIAEMMSKGILSKYRSSFLYQIAYKLMSGISRKIVLNKPEKSVDMLCVKNLESIRKY